MEPHIDIRYPNQSRTEGGFETRVAVCNHVNSATDDSDLLQSGSEHKSDQLKWDRAQDRDFQSPKIIQVYPLLTHVNWSWSELEWGAGSRL